MVWIHGGGFNGGTNFEYPGYFFAERDVVYVALNYRLGMLGKTKMIVFKTKTKLMLHSHTGNAFLADGTLRGNMGLWDNILALEFIRDNIAAFGGDPNQVTIFGQSSGGSNVGILESAPQAEGLRFHCLQFCWVLKVLCRRAVSRSHPSERRWDRTVVGHAGEVQRV